MTRRRRWRSSEQFRRHCAKRCGRAALCLAVFASPFCRPAAAADQALIDAAKKEGSVTWYTVQIVDQIVRPLADAFEQKYGIKVDYVRANTSAIALRITNEAASGHVLCDVFDGATTAPVLKRRHLVLQWLPDAAKTFPAEEVDKEGYWIALYLSVLTGAVNTDLVPPGAEPKSWEDFLDPKWQGKIAWSSENGNTAGAGFVGLVTREYGETKGRAYLQELAQQKLAAMPVSNRETLDQVISGEYPIGLQVNNHSAFLSASKGAPVNWLPINPANVSLVTASVVAGAPHPDAAKLFLDFIVSDEGQAIYRDEGYPPANPNMQIKYKALIPDGQTFRGLFFTPEEVDEGLPVWFKEFKDIFG
jgi:ABC-type Fe3+ transport system substrate-binding protein